MKIYLAGSIPKSDEEAATQLNWREHYIEILKPLFGAEFIIPKVGEVDEADHLLVLGKDSRSIKISDLIIVNAEDRLGAGTAMELVIAKYFSKPVVTVLPKDTYHRRSNMVFNGESMEDWMHPFVAAFSDFVVEKIEDIVPLKNQILSVTPKSISVIDQAVARRELTL